MGDRVLLQCMKVPIVLSPKLHAKWIGPFYITDVGQNNTYKIRRASRIHSNRLKHYEDPRNYRDPVVQDRQQNIELENQIDDENIDQHHSNADVTNSVRDESESSQSNDEKDDENEFLAEKFIAKRKRNGKNFYRVKWVGYKRTSWVPDEDIGEGLLVGFYTKHTKSGKIRKRKQSSCFNKIKRI